MLLSSVKDSINGFRPRLLLQLLAGIAISAKICNLSHIWLAQSDLFKYNEAVVTVNENLIQSTILKLILMRSYLLGLLTLAMLGCLPASSATGAIQFYSDRSTFLGDVNVTTTIDFEGIANPASPHDLIPFSNPTGLTLDGVNFVGKAILSQQYSPPTYMPGFFLFVADGNAASPQMDYQYNSGGELEWYFGDSFKDYLDTALTITLPENTCVFGTDLMFKRNWSMKSNGATNPDNIGTHMTVTLSDGTLYTVNMLPSTDQITHVPQRTFFGFDSDKPIASVTIHAGTLLVNQINGGYSTYMPQNCFYDGGHPLLDNVVIGTCTDNQPVPEPASFVVFGICMAGLGCLTRRGKR